MPDATRSRLATLWAGWPGRIARIVFGVAPLVWLGHTLDVGQVLSAFASVGLTTWLLAFAGAVAGVLVASLRWRVLLGAYGAAAPPGLRELFRHSLVGIYYSILPGGVAGDVLRAYRVRGALSSTGISLTVVLVDRVCGFVGLLLVAAAGMLIERTAWDNQVVLALDIGVACAGLFVLVFLLVPYALRRSEAWRARAASVPLVGRLVTRIPPAHSAPGLLAAVALSVATQALAVGVIALLGGAVHPAATARACARVVPLIILLGYIPLTPAGVGQRELLSVYFFGLVGVPGEPALAISLLGTSLMLSNVALGGVVHLVERASGLGGAAEVPSRGDWQAGDEPGGDQSSRGSRPQ